MLQEKAFVVSGNVKKVIDSIPKVTKKEFVEQAQPCDIITAFSPKKDLDKGFVVRFAAMGMASAQGSPYTTSKIMLDRGEACGYGLTPGLVPNQISMMPLSRSVRQRSEACLIRVPNLTSTQKKVIIQYFRSRKGLKYEDSDLLKSMWNRIFDRKILPFFKDRPLSPEELENVREPLICSTIISTAFLVSGYNKGFNGKNVYDVWPVDFLLDESLQRVCRYDYD